MIVFDKSEIRNALSTDNIFDLLTEWGGDPIYTDFGLLCSTICHNRPGEGSKKLYFYENSKLFHCYTGCENPSFDIFELTIKIFDIQHGKLMDLNDAVRYIAARMGIAGRLEDAPDTDKLVDWDILSNYDRIQNIELNNSKQIILKEYDNDILSRFNYNLKLTPWLNEDITQEVIDYANIGYYLGGDQITIPHFDAEDRFIGLRGRTMCQDEGERYGKYRPLMINKITYNHPLGMNLYGLNWAKEQIPIVKKAIVFESEKSVLKYMSYFGIDNNISVACCGSNLSVQQVQALIANGAEEIIIAFDKQYPALNTEESKRWSIKLTKLHNKYKNDCLITFLWDKETALNYKDSPIDQGKEIFLQLFKERVIL
jgi:hypothetical protein